MTIAERFDKFVEDYDSVGIDPVPEEAQTLIKGIFSSICIRRVHLSDFVIPQHFEDYITIAKKTIKKGGKTALFCCMYIPLFPVTHYLRNK